MRLRFLAALSFLAALGLGVFGSACDLVDSDSDDGSGGAGGGSVCDDKGVCDECIQCAFASMCAGLWDACQSSSACVAVDGCIGGCSTASCKQECLQNNPNGVAAWTAVNSCLYCDACPSDCPGYATCN